MNQKDYIIFALAVLAMILLVLLSSAGQDLWQSLPKLSDLATSPATRELAKKDDLTNQSPAVNEAPPEEMAEDELPDEQEIESPAAVAAPVSVPIVPATAPDSQRSDIIIIPSINVSAPIVTPNTYDAVKLKSLLDDGAVIYPSSPGFGKNGQTILMGHSAPPNWPNIKHDTIFSRLAELGWNDKIMAVYDDRTYTYSVAYSEIIEKGGDIPPLAAADSALVLVSCWPPGRDLQRIIVQAKLDSID